MSTPDDELIVTVRDMRAARMCAGGAREFFARHELDWAGFLRDGISAARLIETGDAMAQQVVEVARGRQQ